MGIYRRDIQDAAIAVLAVAGSMFLLWEPSSLGVTLWALGYVGVLYRALPKGGLRRGRALGRQLTVRIILLVGTLGPLLGADIEGERLAWIAVAALAVITRTEPSLRKAAVYSGLRVESLPSLRLRPKQRGVDVTYCLLAFCAPPLLLLFAFGRVDGLAWLVFAALSAAVGGVVGTEALLRRSASRAAYDYLPVALEEYAPEFAVYWDAPRNSQFQLGMWIPHLKQLGARFYVIVRNPASFAQAVDVAEEVPVVLCRAMRDVDRARPSSLRAVFYVNNAARNSHMVRYSEFTHVQLLHGDSDKAPSFNPVTAMYDKIFVAGQAGRDRYATHGIDIPDERFEIVGRPQVVGIEKSTWAGSDFSKTTVLYAPTWRGYHDDAAYSSMGSAREIVDTILELGAQVVFRPHPYCYRDNEFRMTIREVHASLEEDSRRTGRDHLFGPVAEQEMSVKDCFNASDIMISDVSSVVADFLYSQKPFLIVTDAEDPEEFAEDFPLARAAYVVQPTAESISGALMEVVSADPKRAERRTYRTYYLGDLPDEDYEQAFVTAAARAAQVAVPLRGSFAA